MNFAHAAVLETPKRTTGTGFENVFSQPIDVSLGLALELTVFATVAPANGGDSYYWGKTGVWTPNQGTLVPMLAGDGLRNVFADIRAPGASSWDIRAQIVDAHLNIDISGQTGRTIYWVVRVEYMQWPDLGQYPA